MYILEDLWYGNVELNEKGFQHGSRYGKAMAKLCEAEEVLRGSVPADILPLLDAFENAQLDASALEELNGFIQGFQVGARVMLDVLGDGNSLPLNS